MNSSLFIDSLQTIFRTRKGIARAVDNINLTVQGGEMLAIVGESGCGKTMLALSVLRLVPSPPGHITAGRILFSQKDLLSLTETEMQKIRGNRISMIFQEPMTSLNPVLTVGEQVAEIFRLHLKKKSAEAYELAIEALGKTGIPTPKKYVQSYPHEMSGGMRQRVVISMALACNPDIILADEPTTALDVTMQAQILATMQHIVAYQGASIVLITHDLGIVAQTCTRVAVMYAGKIVEEAPVKELFANPLHPYTRGLLNSLPQPGTHRTKKKLSPIKGMVPSLTDLPQNMCAFHPRCPHAMEKCKIATPPEKKENRRMVRCFLHT